MESFRTTRNEPNRRLETGKGHDDGLEQLSQGAKVIGRNFRKGNAAIIRKGQSPHT